MSAKACKYQCGTLITWDTSKSIFVESDGTSHTKERCASLKQKPAPAAADPTRELAAAIRELAAAIRARGMQ